jgi:DNA-directed RNA polymerase specialized sigma24 family protein
VAEEETDWSHDAGELAACFTVHARDLFGYACVMCGGDRALAGELVQAAFEAASTVWCTLRGLPADQRHDWLRETLAAAARSRTGHPTDSALVSPSHRRVTELKIARYRPDYDAAAGLDRFAGWLRARAGGSPGAGDEPPGQAGTGSADRPGVPSWTGPGAPAGPDGARPGGEPGPGIRLARLRALPAATPASSTNGSSTIDATRNGGPGSTNGTGAGAPSGSYGDPVSALYEQHYAPLVRLAALLVRDTATAEEIVQDAFVAVAAAWRRRGDIDGALDFLRQSVLDRSRSALRHGITPVPPNGCPAASPPLLAALGALPARQREVLVLRYYANLSEEQAADTIGISRAAVRRHATRANAALRTLLDAG